MTDVEQPPPQNGIDPTAGAEDDENSKARPADIEQDMREMERRKRVEAIMGSKLFREELERIVDSAREGGAGASGILQQLSDIVGVPVARVGSVFKSSQCMVPINDIRGVESMGYAKGEKILRCKLAATFRLLDLYGWTQGLGAQITARLKVDQEYFLVNPYGLLYHEITASALNKVDMQGQIVEQGTTNFGVNKSHFVLHSVVHAARPDIRCAIYIGCSPVVAISSLKTGLLPLTKDACVLGEITTHAYTGILDEEERNRLVRSLGPNSKVMLLANHGALCCGETIEEAFYAACHIVQACETQLKLLPVGLDNLVLIPEESRKVIYEQSRRPPEDLEKKFAAVTTAGEGNEAAAESTTTPKIGSPPKWRVGGAEFEALMRMLDNAGYRTGYIYRHPLIKSDPPKPKNDVELPPAVSSLGYLLEEEELFRQGIWKKGDLRKGGDRSRWLNSPNVYQKVEVLETGTPDPKKITKWVAEGSPTHSTPVRIEDPLQFVPAGTNTKEFKRVQQQIKDNRRADKISAGPQSHILEGVTWDEANRIKDATVSQAGDHVVLMGAASKGIIQRGFQHNATVYKAPYAKNPFDNVTDDELNEYKRTVERKKKSIHGEYTDTDFSESEALNSMQVAAAQHTKHAQSEPETEHQVIQIQTQQAPIPSQAEVVLSDAGDCSLNHLQHLIQKYRFLYSPNRYLDSVERCFHQQSIQVFVIHNLETIGTHKHTYPLLHSPNSVSINTSESRDSSGLDGSSPLATRSLPFRTLSHYGFNCPLNNAPSILLHPTNQSISQIVATQRERVVAFIDSAALSFAKRNMLNVLSGKRCIELESCTSDQPLSSTPCTTKSKRREAYLSPILATRSPERNRPTCNEDSLGDLNAQFSSLLTLNDGGGDHSCYTSAVIIQEARAIPPEEMESPTVTSTPYTSEKYIQLEPSKTRRRRNNSAASSSRSAPHCQPAGHDDSLGDLNAQFSSMLTLNSSVGGGYDSCYHSGGVQQDPAGSYVLRNFLPDNHSLPRDATITIDKPEADQDEEDQELSGGRRERTATTSNSTSAQSSQEAEAYSRGKHIKLTLSNSTCSAEEQLNKSSIEIFINISLKNAECVQTVQSHEQEFRAKLEKVIDDEIHYISQQLASQQRVAQLLQSSGLESSSFQRSPLATPTSNTPIPSPPSQAAAPLLRSHSLPALCPTYSYVAAAELPQVPPPTPTNSYAVESDVDVEGNYTESQLRHLEEGLQVLLNCIIREHKLHNRAIINDCRTRISQLTRDMRATRWGKRNQHQHHHHNP